MEAIWIAAALVVAVVGGWPVTAGILKLAKSKSVRAVDTAELGTEMLADDIPLEQDEGPDAPLDVTPAPHPKVEVLRGGLLIGFLERGAVALAILAGQPVAIAYVVAIKGLGRYPELKDTPAASERFIIGTLASMLWAASVAVLVKTLLHIG
ncbi:hypothetical protein SAMN04489740_1803 [Arthrobacter alpinus]|uniref:Uncharacterized protein n=1 Tax=Arthrobacter alpinus TaxID=656366 RepID=A0A1H5JYM2_9MICC|nr:hypothetical protein [Arthrobacter alpinus]SEE57612.1 hypothetical protein SAMN04489740_1803 [Arthrobacter alpinus]